MEEKKEVRLKEKSEEENTHIHAEIGEQRVNLIKIPMFIYIYVLFSSRHFCELPSWNCSIIRVCVRIGSSAPLCVCIQSMRECVCACMFVRYSV